MPLEKSGIALPPYPYGLYGAKPKDVQGRTKTKADCKSGKYINIHIRRCQLDYFVLQIEWHICCKFKGPTKETREELRTALKISVCALNGLFREARLQVEILLRYSTSIFSWAKKDQIETSVLCMVRTKKGD